MRFWKKRKSLKTSPWMNLSTTNEVNSCGVLPQLDFRCGCRGVPVVVCFLLTKILPVVWGRIYAVLNVILAFRWSRQKLLDVTKRKYHSTQGRSKNSISRPYSVSQIYFEVKKKMLTLSRWFFIFFLITNITLVKIDEKPLQWLLYYIYKQRTENERLTIYII